MTWILQVWVEVQTSECLTGAPGESLTGGNFRDLGFGSQSRVGNFTASLPKIGFGGWLLVKFIHFVFVDDIYTDSLCSLVLS